MSSASMASPQSGGDNSGKIKDRSCPFCAQSFTSSSLGRHLDLYIKPKNPKPPDGIHNVDEIRKIRGNITRRQSRVASIKRDVSAPTGTGLALGKHVAEDKRIAASPTIGYLERYEKMLGVTFNKPGWEVTGVMNDLPPRTEARPQSRKGSTKREHQKADLDQRHKVMEELETGRAAQLALRELVDTVRNAEGDSGAATGRNLFDFDFFKSSFAILCLRILSPPPPINSTVPMTASNSWSLHVPWQQQYQALLQEVDDRAQAARQQSSLLSPTYGGQTPDNLDLDKFYRHIDNAFDQWKSLSDTYRKDIWQREILRAYVRVETELKDAQNTILSLRREVEHLAGRLEKDHTPWSAVYPGATPDRYHSAYAPLTSLRFSDDLMKEICKQGLNLRHWDYDRLISKWRDVVQDERRATTGLNGQRTFSSSSQRKGTTNPNISLSAPDSTASRSVSIASARSAAPPTRTSSLDSQEADAEGEDDDADGEEDTGEPNRIPNPNMYQHGSTAPRNDESSHHPALLPMSTSDPRLVGNAQHPHMQSQPSNNDYKWTRAHMNLATSTLNANTMPPGSDAWVPEFHHVAAHSMEGLDGPATGGPSRNVG